MSDLQRLERLSSPTLKHSGAVPEFEAVGNRCAFVTGSAESKCDRTRLTSILAKAGLGVHEIDPVEELRALVAQPWKAELYLKPYTPERAVQWAYGRKGVRIPRTALEQLDYGDSVPWSDAGRGDLVFALLGRTTHLLGLATGSGAVIGAAPGGGTLAEIGQSEIAKFQNLMARRPIRGGFTVLTVLTRSESEIFHSRDIRRLLAYIDHRSVPHGDASSGGERIDSTGRRNT